jgi:WhiB family redox-sensing transcriptional regulator
MSTGQVVQKRTRNWEPRRLPKRQYWYSTHSVLPEGALSTKDPPMIKRSKRQDHSKTTGLSAEAIAELNGRPSELATAPPDPDSESAWMSEGNCRLHPPATFFPSDGVGVDKARKICRDCPVVARCLDYALDERIDHGVWGGCSERERRRILKSRRQDAAQVVLVG